jgi:cytochrome b subunit of formate dehydrogenase
MTDAEWGAVLFPCAMQVLLAGIMASNPYDKETGLPSPYVRSLGNWLLGNIALGAALAWIIHPFVAILALCTTVPYTFMMWDAAKPHNIAANRLKVAERQQKEAVEAAAAKLKALEAAHPPATLAEYKTSSPTEITATAKKLAEQLRQQ